MEKNAFLMKATEIYILLFSTIHLLCFGFSGYSHIFDVKMVSFCTINVLFFLSSAITISFFGKNMNNITKKITPVHLCVLLYALFTMVSGLLSIYFPQTMFGVSRFEGIFTIVSYCLCFILLSLYPPEKKYLLYVFSISVTLFSIVCVIQLFGYNPLSLYPKGLTFYDAGVLYTTAFLGTTGNTNLTGAFICLSLPFFSVLLLKEKHKSRFLLIIPIVLLTFTAIKMGVTSTLLGLFLTVIVTLPIVLHFSTRNTILYFSLTIILSVFLLLLIYIYPFQNGFIYEVHEILHGNFDDSFGSGRIRIWKNVLKEIPDSLLFGKGPDTMKNANFAPFERFYPARNKVMRTGIDVAHNEFLNILYHQGILGLSAYLGFIFFTLRTWIKNRSNTLILALGTALVCYLIQSFFTFSMCITAPYFWIAAGLLIGICQKNQIQQ